MSKSLNVLLFGGGIEGAQALRDIFAAGHTVTGVVAGASEDDGGERLAALAADMELPWTTDPDRNPLAASMADRPDVVLSVGYRRKIGMPFLGLGTMGAFNVAMSQLPRYRGCFPYRWAILNGETAWGVTVHQMTPRYCDGAVLHRRGVAVMPRDTAYDLYRRCADAAARAAVAALGLLAGDAYALVSAEPAGAQSFPAGEPFGGEIDWRQSGAKIDALVRACDFGRDPADRYMNLPRAARAQFAGRTIGIHKANFGGTMSVYPAGTITRCDADAVWVQAGRGHVALDEVFVGGALARATEYFASIGASAGDAFDTTVAWDLNNPTGRTPAATRELSHAA
ncbi:MAG TPA: formyltransferase family protein [Tepidisphaeraceae bacterium]|nr:formyltransferase family protein [Tepidisphaeraceae bacterium]